MEELGRLVDFARRLEVEEAEFVPTAVPYHARNTLYFERGGYVCRDNGRGCGKAFPTREAKNRHQQWCQSARESERCISTSRLLGS